MRLHEIPLQSLPHTAPRTIKLMAGMVLHTYADLLNHIPFRYEDYSTVITIAQMPTIPIERETQLQDAGNIVDFELLSHSKVTLIATVVRFDSIQTRRGVTMQKVQLQDTTGSTDVIWFNQPYLRSILKPGIRIRICGGIKEYKGVLSIQPEEFDILPPEADLTHMGRILPVYQQTRGLSSKTLREKVAYILNTYKDLIASPLPADIENRFELMNSIDAYQNVHFPSDKENLERSRYRLAFDELFTAQLSSHLIKLDWKAQSDAPIIDPHYLNDVRTSFISALPFTLTQSQEQAYEEILHDMNSPHPMNRLLQGDVGSGKTIVAMIAALMTHLHGHTTLCMAPTEILAQQHFVSFTRMFHLVPAEYRPSITLLTSNSKPSQDELKKATIIIGTHALLSQSLSSHVIGLVIVDEQHKFGVVQRAKLKEKGLQPHLLSMTATPIPRTVMLTLYGELDVTRLDSVPEGRKVIKTYLVPPEKRASSYEWIQREITDNQAQVFVVCPLIEESQAESMATVKAVNVEYEAIRSTFPLARVGLIHGKLKKGEKDAILHDFASHTLDILVATPIVEVGIDIPDATIIIIETAERFGLAQLHQLRGRVGRSNKQSYCLVCTDQTQPAILSRLKMFTRTHDGFALAEFDLHRRGAGTLYGTSQHGSHELKIASLSDTELVQATHSAVDACTLTRNEIENIPELAYRLRTYTHDHIARD